VCLTVTLQRSLKHTSPTFHTSQAMQDYYQELRDLMKEADRGMSVLRQWRQRQGHFTPEELRERQRVLRKILRSVKAPRQQGYKAPGVGDLRPTVGGKSPQLRPKPRLFV